eukprot:GABU01004319.1.p1 GENE.GABU01004319.1~~GABU01004319.1.p1  ORF type:complete len:197 (+),score=28.38 GABU01004319.1:31-591(+)
MGTDILPGIGLVYENSELDIMTRRPRDREEHMVTLKLMMFSYAQIGLIQTAGGFVCYCVAMYDYGMNVYSMFGVILKEYYPHNKSDIFDPSHPFFGNTNVKLVTEGGITKIQLLDNTVNGITANSNEPNGGKLLDWLFTQHIEQDLRMGFLKVNSSNDGVDYNVEWSQCKIYQVSPISNRPICYSN